MYLFVASSKGQFLCNQLRFVWWFIINELIAGLINSSLDQPEASQLTGCKVHTFGGNVLVSELASWSDSTS